MVRKIMGFIGSIVVILLLISSNGINNFVVNSIDSNEYNYSTDNLSLPESMRTNELHDESFIINNLQQMDKEELIEDFEENNYKEPISITEPKFINSQIQHEHEESTIKTENEYIEDYTEFLENNYSEP